MSKSRSSSSSKRAVLTELLVTGVQTAKIVVDPNQLGDPLVHGFPDFIVERYPAGIPLDLNPRWPLDLDLDGDHGGLRVSLSFRGVVYRCRVPWRAIAIIGVGFGGVTWEHETDEPPEPPEEDRERKELRTTGHLRIV
jgi:hypothetical protein